MPHSAKKNIRTYIRSLKFHLEIAMANKFNFFAGSFLIICFTLLNTLPPYIIKTIVDSLNTGVDNKKTGYLCIVFIISVILQGLCFFFSRALIVELGIHVQKELLEKIIQKYFKLSKSFFSTNETGDLLTRATRDIHTIFAGFAFAYGLSLMFFCNIIFLGTAMGMISLKLTAIFYSVFIFFPFIIYYLEKCFIPEYRKAQQQVANLSGFAKEVISGIRTIKGYNRENNILSVFSSDTRALYDTNMRLARVMAFYSPVFEVFGSIILIILVYFGGLSVIEQSISMGDFIALQQYCTRLLFTFISFGWIVSMIQRQMISFERVEYVLNQTDTIEDSQDAASIPSVKGEIKIENLSYCFTKIENGKTKKHGSFSHDITEEKYTSFELNTISLHIPAGKTVALVGEIGSGKSLLLALLNRFYRINDNMIFIDGIDINKIPLNQLRKIIGYVEQETYLFGQTIRENLLIGTKEPVTDDEILYYLDTVSIKDEILGFSAGLDTIVGEKGITLSGGQKQRISIARALLAQPEILLFDDSLSALDVDTEAKLIENLRKTGKLCTKVIVTHRLTSIQDVDIIFVFKAGKLFESGTHQELLKKNGEYRRLFETSQKEAA